MTTRTTKFAYRHQDREYLYKTPSTPSCQQDPQIGPRTIDVSWTVYNYCRPEDVGVIKYLSETNVNDYRRR